nr:TIR domain-containing protein [uncultured Sphingomonas sp.]
MKERHEGDAGSRRVHELLKGQRVVLGDEAIATALQEAGSREYPAPGDVIIQQGGHCNDVYFIISGEVEFSINGRVTGRRRAGRTVGEMSAINPAVPRTATVCALDNVALLKVPEPALAAIADAHPVIWRRFAADLVERLEERNSTIKPCNDRPLVFVICATEALAIAQAIQFSLQYDEADFRIWSDEVFRASQYPLEALDQVLEEADFAIAIASPEDIVTVRGTEARQPRDNVLVELGMSIGKLGRKRSMILVPRNDGVALPSDFKGLTPIPYQAGPPERLTELLGPACHQIRAVIREHKVRTDR